MESAISWVPLRVSPSGSLARFPEELGIPVPIVFSTSAAGNTSPMYGDSEVALRNRRAVLEEAGLAGRIVTMKPQGKHGLAIVPPAGDKVVPPGGDTVECDGLMTGRADVALELRAADCFPVVLFGESPSGNICFSLLHAGRTALEGDIVKRGVASLSDEFCVSLATMSLIAGPGICKGCYGGNDLQLKIRVQATEAGLRGPMIFADRFTCHGQDPRFPSSARAEKEGTPQERFMAVVGPLV